MKRLFVLVVSVLLTVSFLPEHAPSKTFSPGEPGLSVEEGGIEINAGLLLQPRFEFEDRETDDSSHTSFSAQRVRALMKGHAYTSNLEYKVLAEFAGGPTLLEGWIQYKRFDPFVIKMGQMTVPFNYERDVPVTKILTTERSITSGEFNWPTGRDAGITLSQKRIGGLEYRLGVFGGQGINETESNSNGVLTSGRATYEILGDYERSESHYRPTETPNLTLGVGGFYAHKNTARNWLNSVKAPGIISTDPDTANVTAATVDLQFRLQSWSIATTYFDREIEDNADRVDDISGNGFTAQLGYILSPNTLYLNARHAQTEPNTDDVTTQKRTNTVGLHLFQKEHGAQVRFEGGVRESRTGSGWIDDEFVRVQQQLSF